MINDEHKILNKKLKISGEGVDSNHRSSGYEPDELTTSLPRSLFSACKGN